MAQGSGIEWTESTWNPITGCDKVSPGSGSRSYFPFTISRVGPLTVQ